MNAIVSFVPGTTVRWRDRRVIVVDCEGLETLLVLRTGDQKVKRVPIAEVSADHDKAATSFVAPDLLSVSEKDWDAAVSRFNALKPLLDISATNRTLAMIKKVADSLGKHPATIYRWIDKYAKTKRISVFLAKERSDRGSTRLSADVEAVIEQAIKDKYLTSEKPDPHAVIEEVALHCFQKGLKRPHGNTILNRIGRLPERTKVAKRRSKKIAAEQFEPIRGHFPGADYPLAVAQMDHTPMDVIVVDEQHRQPIDRPFLTIVIDVFSRMVLGFAIYLEKPSAFTSGLAIAHAVLPKDEWLQELGVKNVDWPCWGKMRKIHCDNAKEFRGTVIGRAAQEHDITVEHRPRGQPRYGGHVERGFRTFMKRVHQLKGTTFSNIEEKAEYDAEGRAMMTRRELEHWFTIYIAKYYPNRYHRGIKDTPLAKYKSGLLGTDDGRPGIGLPERIVDTQAFMLDFMPFQERTVQQYGLLIDHIYFYEDALRPWIHSKDPNDPTKARKFIVRFNPRDMREVYFRDPNSNAYIVVPYRDRSHPPVSRWEILAAEEKLRRRGYANVNEVLIFEAILEMREIEETAEKRTKSVRRKKEKRERPPALPVKLGVGPLVPSSARPVPIPAPAENMGDDAVEAFDDIVEPDGP
ncbi:Transposon Tn7 transposition protein TnsB [Rhodocyclaceae bacterium]|nr:Transposon Tn7 transposition protein TnsB [Rhodocyclaceae bacterium]